MRAFEKKICREMEGRSLHILSGGVEYVNPIIAKLKDNATAFVVGASEEDALLITRAVRDAKIFTARKFLMDLVLKKIGPGSASKIFIVLNAPITPPLKFIALLLSEQEIEFSVVSSRVELFRDGSSVLQTLHMPVHSIHFYPVFRRTLKRSLLPLGTREVHIRSEVLRDLETYLASIMQAVEKSPASSLRLRCALDRLMVILLNTDPAAFYSSLQALMAHCIETGDTGWLGMDDVALLVERLKDENKSSVIPSPKIQLLNRRAGTSSIPAIVVTKNEYICSYVKEQLKIPCRVYTKETFRHKIKKHRKKEIDIVIYNPILSITREVLLLSRAYRIREVSLLFIDKSREELDYLEELRAERELFQKLIRSKSTMGLDITRKAAAETSGTAHKPKMVIDVRELSSELPYNLYLYGHFDISFEALKIGDYLINGRICIERKTLQDFVGSVATGRLYKQLKVMCHVYKRAYLLIEYGVSPHKYELEQNVEIIAHLVIILKTFKKSISVLFSSDAKLFDKVVRKLSKMDTDEGRRGVDPRVVEALLMVDGIDNSNYTEAIKKYRSLKELMQSSRESLEKHFGKKSGDKIFRFFN